MRAAPHSWVFKQNYICLPHSRYPHCDSPCSLRAQNSQMIPLFILLRSVNPGRCLNVYWLYSVLQCQTALCLIHHFWPATASGWCGWSAAENFCFFLELLQVWRLMSSFLFCCETHKRRRLFFQIKERRDHHPSKSKRGETTQQQALLLITQ